MYDLEIKDKIRSRGSEMPIVLDNNKIGSVGEYIKSHVVKGDRLYISSSVFTLFAFNELKDTLSKLDKMSFLFNEPSFIKNLPDSKEPKEFEITRLGNENNLSENIYEIRLKNNLDQGNIASLCFEFIKNKAEVRSVIKSNTVLMNSLLIDNQNSPSLISGSGLGFSLDGLGYTSRPRWDFSTVLNEDHVLKEYKNFYNQLWNSPELVQDVKDELLSYVSNLYKDNSPLTVYYYTLYQLFHRQLLKQEDIAIIREKTGIHETKIWGMLYNFQQDAVVGAIKKLDQYNGCIIADSVGLGKTFEALAVIKYYELRNYRVLVLAPKKLRTNWTSFKVNETSNPLVDDRFSYDVLNHTDLSRETGYSGDINLSKINWSNYDLVVIDESHNFRNKPSVKGRTTRYERMMEDIIKSGVRTKVLMLSATPVNNRLKDLRNQLMFITGDQDDAFEESLNIESISNTLRLAQQAFNEWTNLAKEKQTMLDLSDRLDFDFYSLLNAVTIARSRSHIKKYYDTKDIGDFPERKEPLSVKTDIDLDQAFPSLVEVNQRISKLSLAIYSPLQYVLPTRKDYYDKLYRQFVKEGSSSFTQADREINLVQLMRVNLLKRLESSVFSFNLTVERILSQVEQLMNAISGTSHFEMPEFESFDDEELETYDFGKTKVNIADLDLVRLKQDLFDDLEILRFLFDASKNVQSSNDAKLERLKHMVEEKINNPLNPNNDKILIFTAFADTASYLYEHLASFIKDRFGLYTAIVTGSSETTSNLKSVRSNFEDILIHFSPRSSRFQTENEISVLIATDCISEGQNLQDCDYMINYDIHWNPVRIIQRFGRIDRIGSKNKTIQLVNFWPNMELDEYINLESRVRQRMTMVDFSATGEDDLLNPVSKDLSYRNDQLRQLQTEIVDIEDLTGGIALTDLTLDEYYRDLEKYMKDHPNVLESYPTGIHVVTSPNLNDYSSIPEGVIFCLKQAKVSSIPTKTHSIDPYYLVYVKQDGSLVIPVKSPKKILDAYRLAVKGQEEPIPALIQWFNESTKDGEKMDHYTLLLRDAVSHIIGRVEEEGIQSLFKLGATNIMEHKVSDVDDFELISFVVIHHATD